MDLLTPSSPGVFQLCLWPLIAPGNLGEDCHASHQPSDVSTPYWSYRNSIINIIIIIMDKLNIAKFITEYQFSLLDTEASQLRVWFNVASLCDRAARSSSSVWPSFIDSRWRLLCTCCRAARVRPSPWHCHQLRLLEDSVFWSAAQFGQSSSWTTSQVRCVSTDVDVF